MVRVPEREDDIINTEIKIIKVGYDLRWTQHLHELRAFQESGDHYLLTSTCVVSNHKRFSKSPILHTIQYRNVFGVIDGWHIP